MLLNYLIAHFLITDLNDDVSSEVNSNKSKRKNANDFDFAESFQGKKMHLVPLKCKQCAMKVIIHYSFGKLTFLNFW